MNKGENLVKRINEMIEYDFKTGSGEIIEDFDEVVKRIKEKMAEGTNIVAVGCDSQKVKRRTVFVSAIGILNPDNNGGIFFTKKIIERKKYSLIEKLYKEATIIVELCNKLTENGIEPDRVEAHSDVGFNGKSSLYLKGIVGMIAAYGFKTKIKPLSWASNSIADKVSRKKIKGD
jgi:predicted RNase H-related nuclease YkuK (DUF458 family)